MICRRQLRVYASTAGLVKVLLLLLDRGAFGEGAFGLGFWYLGAFGLGAFYFGSFWWGAFGWGASGWGASRGELMSPNRNLLLLTGQSLGKFLKLLFCLLLLLSHLLPISPFSSFYTLTKPLPNNIQTFI